MMNICLSLVLPCKKPKRSSYLVEGRDNLPLGPPTSLRILDFLEDEKECRPGPEWEGDPLWQLYLVIKSAYPLST